MSVMMRTVLYSMLTVLPHCAPDSDRGSGPPPSGGPDVVLGTVEVGDRPIQLYVDFGTDSAVLGFAVGDGAERRYFPIYGSTYRGMPAVTLEVFASEDGRELWVRSSWPGYDVLAHHRLGTDRAMTRYGTVTALGTPSPERLGGGAGDFPAMEPSKATRVASFEYEE
jgi:hypothetical protein